MVLVVMSWHDHYCSPDLISGRGTEIPQSFMAQPKIKKYIYLKYLEYNPKLLIILRTSKVSIQLGNYNQ